MNFLGLDEENSSLETSKVVILPVPFERTVFFGRGTSRGPSSIIYASRSLELYDDELGWEPSSLGIHTLGELECSSINPADMIRDVSDACVQLINLNKFIITFGGEHSVTIGSVTGHKSKFNEFSVLNIDAHCDLRDSFEKTPHSHACTMRRILEEGLPTVEVGIRSYSAEEAEFLDGNTKIKIHKAQKIMKSKDESWIPEIVSDLMQHVYLSIDMDVFDPSVVPGTGTPEPGGLGWYDVLGLLRSVFKHREVIGLDIVELSPVSGSTISEIIAAKLAYKAIGYKFSKNL